MIKSTFELPSDKNLRCEINPNLTQSDLGRLYIGTKFMQVSRKLQNKSEIQFRKMFKVKVCTLNASHQERMVDGFSLDGPFLMSSRF